MTAAYRIKFADALTDGNLDEFALTGVTAETRLGAAGALSATIPIARNDSAFGARIAAIKSCGGSAVYVYRGGVPWWAGLLWTKARATDGLGHPAVSISAATFESYLDRVQLATDLAALTNTDQLDIARGFLTHMQADPYANMQIVADPTTTTVMRDRVMYLASARPSYLKMLVDLATLDNGFEFGIQFTADPTTGLRTRQLRLGYPTITSPTVHRIDKPGAILTYSLPEDGTRSATYAMATGSGAQSTVHTDTAALNAGYPRLDLTTSYGSITDAAVLEAHAAADLAQAKAPVIIPTIRVRLDKTDLTPQCLGDTVKVGIRDELFGAPLYPVGFTGTYRLVGMTVSPDERGKYEYADLILN